MIKLQRIPVTRGHYNLRYVRRTTEEESFFPLTEGGSQAKRRRANDLHFSARNSVILPFQRALTVESIVIFRKVRSREVVGPMKSCRETERERT